MSVDTQTMQDGPSDTTTGGIKEGTRAQLREGIRGLFKEKAPVEAPAPAQAVEAPAKEPAAKELPKGEAPEKTVEAPRAEEPVVTPTSQEATTTIPATTEQEELAQLREEKKKWEVEKAAAVQFETYRQMSEADQKQAQKYANRLARIDAVGNKLFASLQAARDAGDDDAIGEIQQQIRPLAEERAELIAERDNWVKEAQDRNLKERVKQHESLISQQLSKFGLSPDEIKKIDPEMQDFGDFYRVNEASLKALESRYKAEIKRLTDDHKKEMAEWQKKWDLNAPQARADNAWSGAGDGNLQGLTTAELIKIGLRKAKAN